MIQINYVRYRTFTLSLRILSGAGTRFIRLNGCVRSQAKPKQGRYERRGNESSRFPPCQCEVRHLSQAI
jgi:hypothetical protein